MSKSAWLSLAIARVRDERLCELEREERVLVKLSDGERERERERERDRVV